MPLFAAAIVLAFFSSISMGVQTSLSQGLDLVLPTDNDALFSGDGAAFYQYVERNYKGVKSTPWEGGRYGFVRDPTDTAGGVVYTRFHEGIDIRPLHRDANGDPLDWYGADWYPNSSGDASASTAIDLWLTAVQSVVPDPVATIRTEERTRS